jgi:hypothetical protein
MRSHFTLKDLAAEHAVSGGAFERTAVIPTQGEYLRDHGWRRGNLAQVCDIVGAVNGAIRGNS